MSVNNPGQFGTSVASYRQILKPGTGKNAAAVRNGQLSRTNIDYGIFKNNSNFRMYSARMPGKTPSFQSYSTYDGIKLLNDIYTKQLTESKAEGSKNSDASSAAGNSPTGNYKDLAELGKTLFKAVKSLFDDKSNETHKSDVSGTVSDMETANDRNTLSNAVENAENQQKTVDAQQKQLDGQNKTAQSQANQAQQQADKAQDNLNKANSQMNQNEQALSNAKALVQSCTQNYVSAQNKTANCRQALENAKSQATSDNPNTAAIAQAEADLRTAEAEEAQAKSELDAAKQQEADRQKALDEAQSQVKTSETENSEAQKNAASAKSESESVSAEAQSVQKDNKELSTGIQDGKQRLDTMNNGAAETEQTPQSQEENAGEFKLSENIKDNGDGTYTVGLYTVGKEEYDAALTMDSQVLDAGFTPGSTTDIYMNDDSEPTTFSVQGGKYLVNGQEVDSQTFMDKYNDAQANSQDGANNEIYKTNDDFSKYGSPKSSSTDSASPKNTTGAVSDNSPANSAATKDSSATETKQDTAAADGKKENDSRLQAELNAVRSKNGSEVKMNDKPVKDSPAQPSTEETVSSQQSSSAPKPLTNDEIKQKISDLKPGESYSYSQTTKGSGGRTRTPITWTRNDDNTLTKTNNDYVPGKGIQSFETKYSEDGSQIISNESMNSLKRSPGLKSINNYENGKLSERTTDLTDASKIRSSYTPSNSLLESVVLGARTENIGSQEFKDSSGNVILSFKDGEFYNENGKRIDETKAHRILEKGIKSGNLAKLVQIFNN